LLAAQRAGFGLLAKAQQFDMQLVRACLRVGGADGPAG
jgi:hypothetical protein